MAELDTSVNENVEATEGVNETTENGSDNAELARLRSELSKQKAALDKATKEAAESKRALRAKQSAEEVAAEEAKALQQSMQEELEQLRKEKAVGIITTKVMSFVGDDSVSAQIAEDLYGAADAENALAAIQKAWTAREKALRLEYGKIPAPGVGVADGPTITREQLDQMTFTERVKFANEHKEEYNKLMGR